MIGSTVKMRAVCIISYIILGKFSVEAFVKSHIKVSNDKLSQWKHSTPSSFQRFTKSSTKDRIVESNLSLNDDLDNMNQEMEINKSISDANNGFGKIKSTISQDGAASFSFLISFCGFILGPFLDSYYSLFGF